MHFTFSLIMKLYEFDQKAKFASQVGGLHVATGVIRTLGTSLTCHAVKLTPTYVWLYNSLVVPYGPLWSLRFLVVFIVILIICTYLHHDHVWP